MQTFVARYLVPTFAVALFGISDGAAAVDRTSFASLTDFRISVTDLDLNDGIAAGFLFSGDGRTVLAQFAIDLASGQRPINTSESFPGFAVTQQFGQADNVALLGRSGSDSLFASARASDASGLSFAASAGLDHVIVILPNTQLTFSALASVSYDLDPGLAHPSFPSISFVVARMAFGNQSSRLILENVHGTGSPLHASATSPIGFQVSTGSAAASEVLNLGTVVSARTCRKPRFNLF